MKGHVYSKAGAMKRLIGREHPSWRHTSRDRWNRLQHGAVLFALLLLVGLQRPAEAHKIKCFATAENGRIAGYAWMSGGVRPENIPYRVLNPQGAVVREGKTGEGGAFAFAVAGPFEHTIVVHAGEGHVARFTVPAEELRAVTSAPLHQAAGPTAEPSVATNDCDTPPLSTQVALLEKELAACRRALALRNALAGVGLIFGMTGAAFYLAARQKTGGGS